MSASSTLVPPPLPDRSVVSALRVRVTTGVVPNVFRLELRAVDGGRLTNVELLTRLDVLRLVDSIAAALDAQPKPVR